MGDGPSYLVAPGEPDDSMTGGFTNPIEIFDWVSPSAWINGIIEKTTGFDFIGSCTEFVTGDWEALYKFGDAMNAMAQFPADERAEIERRAREQIDSDER